VDVDGAQLPADGAVFTRLKPDELARNSQMIGIA
jgi:hypothetical protein